MRAPTARQRAETERLHAQVDYVHRYWKRELGAYPRPDESMSIVVAIAAMNEMAAAPHVGRDGIYTVTPTPSATSLPAICQQKGGERPSMPANARRVAHPA